MLSVNIMSTKCKSRLSDTERNGCWDRMLLWIQLGSVWRHSCTFLAVRSINIIHCCCCCCHRRCCHRHHRCCCWHHCHRHHCNSSSRIGDHEEEIFRGLWTFKMTATCSCELLELAAQWCHVTCEKTGVLYYNAVQASTLTNINLTWLHNVFTL